MKALFSGIITVFALVICCQSCMAQDAAKGLSVTDFKTKISKDSTAQLVDVRTPEEFAAGYIKNATNINYLGQDFETQIQKLNKNRPVLLYCKAGIRSLKAAAIMQKLGFKELYNLDGGYQNWVAKGEK